MDFINCDYIFLMCLRSVGMYFSIGELKHVNKSILSKLELENGIEMNEECEQI